MKDLELKSPENERHSIHIPADAARLDVNFNGTVCAKEGPEHPVKNNIIDLLTNRTPKSTLAQMSNHWKLTASVYEDVWRANALSIMTGESFPLEREKELLVDWMLPEDGKSYLDVGCSTALYTRAIGKRISAGHLVALDFSNEMLAEARTRCKKEKVDTYLLRADASEMPFFSDSFDGLACGGSLNEFYDPAKVLYEMKRVIKDDGVLFMMHLLGADSWYGKLMQEPMKLGGLHFWSVDESNKLFERTGFMVERQEVQGIVCFTKLRPTE